MSAPTTKSPAGQPAIDGARALAIAQADALKAYHDLSLYRVQIAQEQDGWHVDYELKNPRLKGGGPRYIIDAVTGVILTKRYEQ
jgi:hypothetical protein